MIRHCCRQEPRMTVETDLADEAQGLSGMQGQVGRQHVGHPVQTLTKRLGGNTRAGGKESMQKQNGW